MIKRIKQAAKNPFLRNVSTLASGTIISQLVVIASSLILTRIYSIEAFGLYSVFTSISTFFAVIVTGRYEYAIGLPEKNSQAIKIIRLIISLGFLISLFYLIVIFILNKLVNYNDSAGFLEHNTSYLAPLYIFQIAINSSFAYWFQRKKKYKIITIANALQVITTTLISLLFGFLGVQIGMILSLLIGISCSILFYYFKERASLKGIFINNGGLKEIAKEYISFPKFMIFSDLSKTASQQIIPVLFSALFSTTVVGLFSFSNRILRLPNIVITSAIGNVFRNDAIDEIRLNGSCKQLYISTFKKLLIMSVPIYTGIFIFAPSIFKIAFGEKWLEAGYYARILSVLLLVEFIATPLSTLFYVRERQKILMRLQFINTILGIIAIFLGAHFFNSPMYSLSFFALSSLLFNFVILIFSYKIAL